MLVKTCNRFRLAKPKMLVKTVDGSNLLVKTRKLLDDIKS